MWFDNLDCATTTALKGNWDGLKGLNSSSKEFMK